MDEINQTNQDASKVEKISLSELKSTQAEMQFEETANKIINDPGLAKKGLNYLLEHPDEYYEIFGIDLKTE